MAFITEQARKVKVLEEVDICVVGGGVTGVFAAVRAAELGAKVALVERQNCLGGAATGGMVAIWHSLYDFISSEQIIGGLTEKVIESLFDRKAIFYKEKGRPAFCLNTEELKIELDRLITEANVSPHLHTMYAGPYLIDEKPAGIFVQNKSGRSVILAKYFVDASGDGDLCRDLGFSSYTADYLQPPTMCCKIHGLGNISRDEFVSAMQTYSGKYNLPEDWGWSINIPGSKDIFFHAENHIFNVDCSKADDLTKAEIEGRRLVGGMIDLARDKITGAEDIILVSLASVVGVRETKRYYSLYQLSTSDVLEGRPFDDAIANGTYPVDIHHSDRAGITFRYLDGTEKVWNNRRDSIEGRWREKQVEDPRYYQIPYRSMIPRDSKNVVMCGRMIDSDQGAFGAIRVMVNLNQTGEAAGVAAYLALQEDKEIKEVNPATLRKKLSKGGSIIL